MGGLAGKKIALPDRLGPDECKNYVRGDLRRRRRRLHAIFLCSPADSSRPVIRRENRGRSFAGQSGYGGRRRQKWRRGELNPCPHPDIRAICPLYAYHMQCNLDLSVGRTDPRRSIIVEETGRAKMDHRACRHSLLLHSRQGPPNSRTVSPPLRCFPARISRRGITSDGSRGGFKARQPQNENIAQFSAKTWVAEAGITSERVHRTPFRGLKGARRLRARNDN
jgi:hypothetical protein